MAPRVLITGFEPFGGGDRNPSGELALELRDQHGLPADVTAEVLPVVFRKASAIVRALITDTRPAIVFAMGLAGSDAALHVERRGVNYFRGGPDNEGRSYGGEEIVEGGPEAYPSTFPVARLLDASRQCGVPARDSRSAGSYCCNEVLYTALHTCAEESIDAAVGFVHLPAFPAMVGEGGASMACEMQFEGLRAMLAALVDAQHAPA